LSVRYESEDADRQIWSVWNEPTTAKGSPRVSFVAPETGDG